MKSAPYEKLKFYQNICDIRRFVYKITERFGAKHIRLVSQMRDAARSAKQNIREGYRKDSLREFVHYIKISAGSLEELSGDVEDCHEDELISESEFEKLINLIGLSNYQVDRYIDSLFELEKEGKWKTRFRK
jgi:four helix bundle protein